MKAIMETAMKAGAIGMTTALIYPPSSYATTDELIEMAKVAGQYGGIYASHIRGEGKELVQSVEEAIAIGESGGLPVEIFHLKAAHQPGWGTLMRQAGEKIEAGTRPRRRCCGGYLSLHGGRDGTGSRDPIMGFRGRSGQSFWNG